MRVFLYIGAAFIANYASAGFIPSASSADLGNEVYSQSSIGSSSVSYGGQPSYSANVQLVPTVQRQTAVSSQSIGGGVSYANQGASSLRTHEIHTGGGSNVVRVEEHRAGGQVIRVHDAPQAGVQQINVQGPAAQQNYIRLVSRSGPTRVERVVVRDPSTQVYDVQSPPAPADRIINIRSSPAPPARVELVADQHHSAPVVELGSNEGSTQVVRVAAAPSVATVQTSHSIVAAPVATISAAPVATYSAAPVATYSAAPVASYSSASYSSAPIVQTFSASPVLSHSYSPSISTSSGYSSGSSLYSVAAAPSHTKIITSSYGASNY